MSFFSPKIFRDLSTERLVLREPRLSDTEDVFEFCSDPASCRYVDWHPHQSKWETRDYIAYLKRHIAQGCNHSYTWFAQLKNEKKVIATVSLVELDSSGRIATVGYTFSGKYQHKGLATEALLCLIHYLFEERSVERVQAKVLPDNLPSIRLLERVGMKREALLRKGVFCKTSCVDVCIYSVLRAEFEKFYRDMLQNN